MRLYHATTRTRLVAIQQEGLRIVCVDPAARIKAVWLASASNRGWGVLHTLRKHEAALHDVVVLEVTVPRAWLTRFRPGLWYCSQDIPPTRLGAVIGGAEFGKSASD